MILVNLVTYFRLCVTAWFGESANRCDDVFVTRPNGDK